MSLSVAGADSSESTCNIVGAMLWQINSQNGVLVNLAAVSIWLSQVMHSVLLLPLKILMFFIICLLTLSFLLLLVTCVMICVRASVMLADGASDVLLNGVWIVVLVLGWLFSNRFWNNGLLLGAPAIFFTKGFLSSFSSHIVLVSMSLCSFSEKSSRSNCSC